MSFSEGTIRWVFSKGHQKHIFPPTAESYGVSAQARLGMGKLSSGSGVVGGSGAVWG